jgi:hypothetical protein
VSYFYLDIFLDLSNKTIPEKYSRTDLNDQGLKQMISQLNQCPSGLLLDFSTLICYSARMYHQKLLGELNNVGGLRLSGSSIVDPEKLPSRLTKLSLLGTTIPLKIEKWLELHHTILEELTLPVSG